ncbi:DUF4202 domain-containing protein [Algoriphagus sp. A40]|uniref:DUF4202 domain-containing protein n=1 Tax=Algoriphagus sp. A40 TaxID=1945863 RepID=UPI000985D4C0|nr:DUF4202 domain-containing protein [Algoriphagus sp. A40]OOG76508.1 hypothetical protein B0E43_08455 [Algoriphagus sp. A40]
MNRFDKAIQLIDQINSEDPTKESWKGKDFPKELLYSHRMTKKLGEFAPDAAEHLKIAARAQHIGRWKIQRSEYPMDRTGYLTWREDLKKMHAEMAGKLLEEFGYEEAFISKVKFLIRKKQLKTDFETQILEDVVCLVFLEYYFEEFVAKHEFEKIKDILKKTWAKMSEKGQKAALQLNFSSQSLRIIQEALFDSND